MALRRTLALILLYSLFQERITLSKCILYPQESETREVQSLNGLWNFRLSPDSVRGYAEKWFARELRQTGPTIAMPVPASYNDITVNKKIRDYVGVVWYDRTFFVPESWRYQRKIWLRFGSVCYTAEVWINGVLVTGHEIGHLPFEAEVTPHLKFGEKNLVTVAVDNTLLQATVPQGYINEIPVGNETLARQTYTFDFFNYAGIDRPVYLYTTPPHHITDITVITNVDQDEGTITFSTDLNAEINKTTMCDVKLIDKGDMVVVHSKLCAGEIRVRSPRLWWPFLMDPDPGYLYTLQVQISNGQTRDIYRLKIGIRTIRWTNTQLLINDRPIYIRGVGKHEDSDIRGKGLDLAVVLKDFNLLKWLGVNTFRTSHYPYAEEIMDLADEMGIMVIDECPSVDTDGFSATLLEKHQNSISELIRRDKNRPSVIMWSAANEPRSQQSLAEGYFKRIVDHIKLLDTTRPVTIAISRSYTEDKAAQFLDVISFNRYNSWYHDTGVTEVIYSRVVDEVLAWYDRFQKPILMTEYGADAFAGLHTYPESVWSEEYQGVVLQEHFKAFDCLRKRGFFIGEMVWNFADFKTAQTPSRVGGNKKGIFTRQREPKSTAFLLRMRYNELANELDGAPFPGDLYAYTTSNSICSSESEQFD